VNPVVLDRAFHGAADDRAENALVVGRVFALSLILALGTSP